MKALRFIKIFHRIMSVGRRTLYFSVPWFLILVGTLVSCSPQWRLERLINHHPELRTPDTIGFIDTVITPLVRLDTVLPLVELSAPVILRHDRLELSMIRIHDTIRLHAACNPDTIIRTLRIPVEKIKLVKSPPVLSITGKILLLSGIILVVLAIVAGVFKIANRN
ncbi:MAG: hypothetical protein EOM90_12135 [Alphaproteobacteria bacterium]|nr:hypothetical protein [Alphaproteobacteria bacterium]